MGHSVISDPVMDEALETFRAVNREQLGSFMMSFAKFIDSGGQLSSVVSPGSTNQSPAIVNPEGGSSIAPVVNIEAVITGCQSSKQQTKSLDPLVLKDLSSTFRDTKGHTKSKVPKHREVSVAPSSSSSGNENNVK